MIRSKLAHRMNRRTLTIGCITCFLIFLGIISALWAFGNPLTIETRREIQRARLENARELWNNRTFSAYQLTIQISGHGVECQRQFEIRDKVQKEIIVDTCGSHPTSAHLVKLLGYPSSTPDLFDYIQSTIDRIGVCGPNGCACDGAIALDINYNKQLGFPESIHTYLKKDWTTRGWPPKFTQRCTLVGLILPGQVTASVDPLE